MQKEHSTLTCSIVFKSKNSIVFQKKTFFQFWFLIIQFVRIFELHLLWGKFIEYSYIFCFFIDKWKFDFIFLVILGSSCVSCFPEWTQWTHTKMNLNWKYLSIKWNNSDWMWIYATKLKSTKHIFIWIFY